LFCLVAFDYSQIEMRVLAFLADDKILLSFFDAGKVKKHE